MSPEQGEGGEARREQRRQWDMNQRLDAALTEVQNRFAGELASDLDCVNTLVEHIEQYRGKMLRPTLVLAVAAGCGADLGAPPEPHLVLATVVEMVHMATLVHDDILDEAQLRRGGGTINELSGNEAAVMLGDYLISHAYHLCSSLEDPTVARAIAAATNVVCEGELLQLANRHNTDVDERTYFEIIRRKTARLCGVSCELAARLCDAEAPTTAALTHYGEKLGIAFQIIDDVLDVSGDATTVGKTLGRDVQKGKLTLPLIRFLAEADDEKRGEVVRWLEAVGDDGGAGVGAEEEEAWRVSVANDAGVNELAGAGLADADMTSAEVAARLRERVLSADVLDYCRAWAERLVEDAKEPIKTQLPPSPAQTLLLAMADAVLTRRR